MYQLAYLISLYGNDDITLDETIRNIRQDYRDNNLYVLADNIVEYDPDIITNIMKFGINLRLHGSTCSPIFLSFIITEYPHNRWEIVDLTKQDILRELVELLDDCKLKYVSEYARDEDIVESILLRCSNCKCIHYKQYKFGMDTENLDQYIPNSLTTYYLYTLDDRAKQIIIDNNVCFEFNLIDIGDIEFDICNSHQFQVRILCTCDDIIKNKYMSNKILDIIERNKRFNMYNIKIECIDKARTYQQLVRFIDFNIKPAVDIILDKKDEKIYSGLKDNYYKALLLYPDVKQLADKYPELLSEDYLDLIT